MATEFDSLSYLSGGLTSQAGTAEELVRPALGIGYIGTALALNNTCDIQRRTSTVNSKNQKTFTDYIDENTDVRCRLVPKSGKEFINLKWVTISKLILYLQYGTDIEEDDQVVINSQNYTVQFVNHNPGNSTHHVEAELTLVEK